MAQFTIYRSSDASAPTLSGTVGDLVNLLDKCLVTGYGAKTAAGWTKPYTGTNKAAFRMGGGNQFYLRVQDDGPSAFAGREARLVGYEAMTAVDTGTNPFPTVAQKPNGLFARKSSTPDAVTRSWIVFADDRTVYVFMLNPEVSPSAYTGFMFGDIYSIGSSDNYRTMIIARDTEAAALNSGEGLEQASVGSLVGNFVGHYMARGYTGGGGSVNVAKYASEALHDAGTGNAWQGTLNYPNPSDGGVYITPLSIIDTNTGGVKSTRGRMRGFWWIHHPQGTFADGDTLQGTGAMAAYSFIIVKRTPANAPFYGMYLMETSNTLETN
jgi:hypothetical protein